MSAIEIRLLTPAESWAYTVKGAACAITGCNDNQVYLAVYQQAGRVHRDLLCGHHGAAWAGQHRQPLPTRPAVTS